jgi:hypothetical protein
MVSIYRIVEPTVFESDRDFGQASLDNFDQILMEKAFQRGRTKDRFTLTGDANVNIVPQVVVHRF